MRLANGGDELAKAPAEAANQAGTDLLASKSHEIRKATNGIIGHTDLPLHDARVVVEHRRHLKRVRTAGSALPAVVNDVLDFPKIEAGRAELGPRTFSSAAFIDNTVSITRGLAERKGLQLRTTSLPASPTVRSATKTGCARSSSTCSTTR